MNLLPSHHHHDFLHHEPLWALLSLSRISLCASPDTPTYANNPLFIESSQSIEHKPGSELQHRKYSVLPPFKPHLCHSREFCHRPGSAQCFSQVPSFLTKLRVLFEIEGGGATILLLPPPPSLPSVLPTKHITCVFFLDGMIVGLHHFLFGRGQRCCGVEH